MADTFIDYKDGKGFWIHESAMELTFQYIYKELKTGSYIFSDIEELLYDCETIVNGFRRSYLVFPWDEEELTQQDKQEMIRLLEKILSDFRTKDEYISVEELQSFPEKADSWEEDWVKPILTQNMIYIFEALVQILKGEWESTDYNMDEQLKWPKLDN